MRLIRLRALKARRLHLTMRPSVADYRKSEQDLISDVEIGIGASQQLQLENKVTKEPQLNPRQQDEANGIFLKDEDYWQS